MPIRCTIYSLATCLHEKLPTNRSAHRHGGVRVRLWMCLIDAQDRGSSRGAVSPAGAGTGRGPTLFCWYSPGAADAQVSRYRLHESASQHSNTYDCAICAEPGQGGGTCLRAVAAVRHQRHKPKQRVQRFVSAQQAAEVCLTRHVADTLAAARGTKRDVLLRASAHTLCSANAGSDATQQHPNVLQLTYKPAYTSVQSHQTCTCGNECTPTLANAHRQHSS